MCGLAGIVTTKTAVSRERLRAAADSLHHRGPDESSVWVNPSMSCGLAHTRLSIIDLAGGHQPLSSADGTIHAVVNGEFYDYESIREDFIQSGYNFQTSSDSEILIPLYLRYGTGCLEYLRGEFSLILWDENSERLLIARDRFGIKPLFYGEHNGSVYVGSEVKALLAMGMPAHWDLATVVDEERGHRNCQDTLFRDVKALSPGHFMVLEKSHRSVHKYWDLNYPTQRDLKATQSAREYIEEFRSLLSEAVALRLRADVPVGVYLSGGIDSSTVLALMSQHLSSNFDAFTLSFDQAAFDEGDIAREMAARVGVRHTVIDIDPAELAPNFEGTIWHNESPFTNNNTIAKYILSRHVRDAGLKVVLTGEGSDEILGGYHHYLSDMRCFNSSALGPMLGRAKREMKQRYQGWTNKETNGLDEDYQLVMQKFGFVPRQLMGSARNAAILASLRHSCLKPSDCSPHLFVSLMDSLDSEQLEGRDPLNQSLYLSCKSFLPNRILTTLGDRVEMAHSIEARLPFLDHKVVEFLTRLPVEMKIKVSLRSGVEKHILKEAARPYLTDTLYHRRKHPFTAPPTISAVSDPMSEIIEDTLYGSDTRRLELYDQRKVIELYERSRNEHNGEVSRVMQHVAGLAIMQRQFSLSL